MNSQSQQLIQDLKTWSFEIEDYSLVKEAIPEIILTSINKPSKYTIYLSFDYDSEMFEESATYDYPRQVDFTFNVTNVYVDFFLDEDGERVKCYITKEHEKELCRFIESELEQEAYEKFEY